MDKIIENINSTTDSIEFIVSNSLFFDETNQNIIYDYDEILNSIPHETINKMNIYYESIGLEAINKEELVNNLIVNINNINDKLKNENLELFIDQL